MIAVLPLHAHHNATVHQSPELMGHIIKTETSGLLGQAIRGQPMLSGSQHPYTISV